jgi:hypothetical protein
MSAAQRGSLIRSIVLIMIALGFFIMAIVFRRGGGLVSHAIEIAIALVGLSAIAVVGLWLITLPWMAKYRHSSKWFRDVAIAGGLAALVSSGGHSLLLSRPQYFTRVTSLELQIVSFVLGGMWMGLLFSLLYSAEFWEPRRPSVWRDRMLRKRQV